MRWNVGAAVLLGLVWLGNDVSRATDATPLPEGPLGATIALGRELVEKTTSHPLTKPYVGNSLNCTSCHLKNGTDPRAASFLGVATAYPAWSPREGRVVTLEDRVLNCFMRSCHGVRPPLGGKPSVAITTYITWLSVGQPIQPNNRGPHGPRAIVGLSIKADKGEVARGAALYNSKCADCHAADGAGQDANPPVWGDQSFNHGAGLSKPDNLAAWLKVSMPLDDTALTEQEAVDIAVYVTSKPRPAFVLDEHLPTADRLGEYNAEKPGTPAKPK